MPLRRLDTAGAIITRAIMVGAIITRAIMVGAIARAIITGAIITGASAIITGHFDLNFENMYRINKKKVVKC
jgi:hypothetical protein